MEAFSVKNDTKRIKTGIMGGTFNPIHNGHLAIAQSAYETVGLDKVLFMPSGNSYMKKHVLALSKRLDMVRLAIREYPWFELSLVEAEREGNTYTCETLQQLTRENPEVSYYFIMGADSLFHIEEWREPERIFSMAALVCAVREDYGLERLRRKGEELARRGAEIVYLNTPKIPISSTQIRARVRGGLSISELVPERVAEYITQEHLYYEEN
ncbi:MAG: nicotinate-nucleotide adenylyltransferase [Roseburia sp.]|nr:nicotinate-nucleotide adenylyltransferase [Roseburia sp.]